MILRRARRKPTNLKFEYLPAYVRVKEFVCPEKVERALAKPFRAIFISEYVSLPTLISGFVARICIMTWTSPLGRVC
jgi:hypothetical protein